MNRRHLMSGMLTALTGVAGCLAESDSLQDAPSPSPDSTGSPTTESAYSTSDSVGTTVTERVKTCEKEYIESQLLSNENESITDFSGPTVATTEVRTDGAHIELETQVGTVRSREGEPDEHADYVVNAAYLVTDDRMYRTTGFDFEENPQEGTTVEC